MRSNDLDNGRILDFLVDADNKIMLTAKQQQKAERIQKTHQLLAQYRSEKTVKELIMKEFQLTSLSQAYELIRASKFIYGQINPINKQYARQTATEMALKTYAMALESKDLKAMSMATRDYIEATGIKHDDGNLLPDNVFTRHIILIQSNPEKLNLKSIDDLDSLKTRYLEKYRDDTSLIENADIIQDEQHGNTE